MIIVIRLLVAGAVGYVAATPTGKKIINKTSDAAFSVIKSTVDKAISKYKIVGKKDETEFTPTEQ